MNIAQLEPEMKVAILLNALGDSAELALAEVQGDRERRIRESLSRLQASPVDPDLESEVLDDFERFFRFAIETATLPASWMTDAISQADTKNKSQQAVDETEEEEEPPRVAKPTLKIFQPSDDPYDDLNRLAPIQVAGALANERPKTIAILLGLLEKNIAASIIQELPPEKHAEVFLQLKLQPSAPKVLLDRIVATTIQCASKITTEKQVEVDVIQKLADLLRSLPKQRAAQIMDDLRAADEETANHIDRLLYIFSDVVNYDDRSIQKLLSETETATLVVALQDAGQETADRILNNLSKRAKVALQEELDLARRKSEAEVNEARDAIAAIIGKLDKAGQLNAIG
jgi:flagellar motor switch protein FliG